MEPKVPLQDFIHKDVRTTKHYKQENFKWWYTENELSNILVPARGEWVSQSDVLCTPFEDALQDAKSTNKRHKWTWIEDEFLLSNYKYLSDNVIGLALNIPGRIVKLRRMSLGLKKGIIPDTYKVIVWCNRDYFEDDVKNYNLIGALPDKQRKGVEGV